MSSHLNYVIPFEIYHPNDLNGRHLQSYQISKLENYVTVRVSVLLVDWSVVLSESSIRASRISESCLSIESRLIREWNVIHTSQCLWNSKFSMSYDYLSNEDVDL